MDGSEAKSKGCIEAGGLEGQLPMIQPSCDSAADVDATLVCELPPSGLKGRRLKLGDTHPHTHESIKTLIDLYEAWNKPEEADKWREKLIQTEAVIE